MNNPIFINIISPIKLMITSRINYKIFKPWNSTLMKKLALFIPVLLGILHAKSQSYWQQSVNYTIDVSLNDREHSLKGFLTLEYTNNSPDQLDFIWFHLWPNAYKNDKTAYAKQVVRESDGKKRLKDIKDKGFIDSLSFSVDGKNLNWEPHPEHIDIIRLPLSTALAPGKKITITTPFYVKLPTYSSRMGHLDQSYMICQWYPKPAVYDRKGWHVMPYLDQGEFYSEFGSFKVNITLPSQYIVGATGILHNQQEIDQYKNIGASNWKNGSSNTTYQSHVSSGKTLSYTAENVHDFAWFADKNFIIEYDTMQLGSGKVIDVFSYHQANGNALWENSIGYIEDAVRNYSKWIGEYPYPVVAAVEGPKNAMSGGMEYPMITLITSPDANEERLDAVITHEVGHNWFYGIIGSNERAHAWMDEGINTYYQFRYEAEKYKSNSIFGDMIPAEVKAMPPDQLAGLIYSAMSRIPMEKPIETHSAEFSNKDEYGLVVYLKTAIWMYIMEVTVGKDNLDKAIQAYFNDWKFRHPYPEDFEASVEKALGKSIDELFEIRKKTGSLEN